MDEKTIVANAGEQSELISVIIPTYNRVGLLERSVKSVLSQTYTNLELLIIDDCSNDATGEFVKGLSDKRIRYYRNEQNIGPAASKTRERLWPEENFWHFRMMMTSGCPISLCV